MQMATVAVEGAVLGTEAIAGAIGGTAARASIAAGTRAMGASVTRALGKHGFDVLNVLMMGMMSMPPSHHDVPEHHDAPQPINPPPPPPAKPPDPPLPTPAVATLAPIPPPPPPPPPPKAPTDFSANGGAGSNEPQHVYNETHHGESSQITSDSSPLVTLIAIAGGGFILFYAIKKLT